ncbi:hypothetical protein YC2023_116816 [Brassica napus]
MKLVLMAIRRNSNRGEREREMVVTIVRIESIDGSLSVYDSPVPSSSVSFTLVSEVRVIDLGRGF